MKLQRVKIFGFKTFADRTEFELDGDLVAVVGPNGCGKSNIVDAIMWGLGEPNARNLRANSSQEVIFSGSKNRKALGFAEVSLHFDNSDGGLGIDAPDVVVSRKLSRSGDSEYQINKRNCRQKDIFDLLADSGLGRTGYAIVGQKDIDAALSASAEERRAWIDEAAGVQRYRAKRVESMRRLAAADQNLARVADIINEIEAQREPLRKQAETAMRYREVLHALRDVEVSLLAFEFGKAVDQITELDTKIQKSLQLASGERVRAEILDKEMGGVGEEIAEAERKIDALREVVQSLLSSLERMEADGRLAHQRLDSLDELERSLKSESETSQAHQDDAARAIQEAHKEKAAADDLVGELFAASATIRTALNQAKEDLAAHEELLAKARQAQSDRVTFQAHEKARKERLKLIAKEMAGIRESWPDMEEAVAEAMRQTDEVRGEHQAMADELKSLTEAGHNADAEIRRLDATRRDALGKIAQLEGQANGIRHTIEAHEGVSQGARAVLAAVDAGLLPDNYTLVAEAVTVDDDLTLAIETALGASANDLIVDHEGQAKEAIEWLKQNRAGRATFQPVSLMRGNSVSADLHRASQAPGVIGIANQLVQVLGPGRPVIDSLLGRALIVEDLDSALKLAKTPGWSRLVTLDGELIHSSGAVTGGQANKQGSGLLQRKADLAHIEEQVSYWQGQLRQIEKRIQAAHAPNSEAKQTELRGKIEAMQGDLRDSERWLHSLQSELSESQKSLARLEREVESLTPEVAPELLDIDVAQVERERDEQLKATAQHEASLQSTLVQLKDAELRAGFAQAKEEDARRRADFVAGGATDRLKKLDELEAERVRLMTRLEELAAEKVEASARLEKTREDLTTTTDQKAELLQSNVGIADELKAIQKSISAAEEVARHAEVERAKLDAKRSTAYQRLLEDYGIDEQEAYRICDESLIPDDARQTVQKLRSEIRQMGEVNLGAIEAYEQLSERYVGLKSQYDDIIAGKQEIEAGIKELDTLTRGKFMDTFEVLKGHFAEFFTELFGGGEAEMSLTDHENVLDTGVNIEVQIPGKRRQRLELLSGGERALSACAFLFALLKCKPSPLVILDEVDAPLDGRNVERFIGCLKKFTGQIQFILITHNPLTIESAPVWFGVTMQEPGVTTLVPFRSAQRQQMVETA